MNLSSDCRNVFIALPKSNEITILFYFQNSIKEIYDNTWYF